MSISVVTDHIIPRFNSFVEINDLRVLKTPQEPNGVANKIYVDQLVSSQVEELIDQIDDLEELTVGDLEIRVANLESRADAIEPDVSDNTTDIGTIQSQISSIQSINTTQDSQISSANINIQSLDGRVTNLESRADGVDASLSIHTSAISENTAKVYSNELAISSIQSINSTQSSQIGSNITAIQGLDSRVSNLEASALSTTIDVVWHEVDGLGVGPDVPTQDYLTRTVTIDRSGNIVNYHIDFAFEPVYSSGYVYTLNEFSLAGAPNVTIKTMIPMVPDLATYVHCFKYICRCEIIPSPTGFRIRIYGPDGSDEWPTDSPRWHFQTSILGVIRN
jgi:predicted  nucleic acid-binding Zn-ribbon protein